jgi:methyl-accepting chemotaxis protein
LFQTFFRKMFALSLIGSIVLGSLLLTGCYLIQERMLLKVFQDQVLGLSNQTLSFIPDNVRDDALADVRPDNPAQGELKSLLDSLAEGNDNIAQAYFFSGEVIDGRVLVMGVPSHLWDFSPPGTHYAIHNVLADAVRQAAETKEHVMSAFYTDELGTWVTSVMPILDGAGNVLAVYCVDVNASIVKNAGQTMIWTCMLILAALIIVTGGVLFILLRKFLSPIPALLAGMKRVGMGDLHTRIDAGSKDEFGQLAQAFNEMVQENGTLLRKIKAFAADSAQMAEQLTDRVKSMTAQVHQITASVQEVAAKAAYQLESTENSARAVNEIAVGIERIATGTSAIAEGSSHTSKRAKDGNESIQSAVEQMDAIKVAVTQAKEDAEALRHRTEEIGKILVFISEVASQTNLLALNAAIEAARAGENGKGFAVVADEVRKLSDQTQEAAKGIARIIRQIQADTANVAEAMNRVDQNVAQGIRIVREAGGVFHAIAAEIEGLSEQIEESSAVSEQISAGSEEVAATIADIAAIARNTAGTAQEVAQTAVRQLELMQQIAQSSDRLSAQSAELAGMTEKYSV